MLYSPIYNPMLLVLSHIVIVIVWCVSINGLKKFCPIRFSAISCIPFVSFVLRTGIYLCEPRSVSMSQICHTMETFILPRSLLLLHTSSVSFQRSHLLYAGSYVLELIMLIVMLSASALYGSLPSVKRSKSNDSKSEYLPCR